MVPYIGIDILRGNRWSIYLTDCSTAGLKQIGLVWRITVQLWLDDVCEQWQVTAVGETPAELATRMQAHIAKAVEELEPEVTEAWCDKYPHAEYGFTPVMPVIDWSIVKSALFGLVAVENMTEVAAGRTGPQAWCSPKF